MTGFRGYVADDRYGRQKPPSDPAGIGYTAPVAMKAPVQSPPDEGLEPELHLKA